MGNSSNVNIEEIILKNQTNIFEFLNSSDTAYLEPA